MAALDELKYEMDLMNTDLDEDFFDKIKKLGDAGSKAKEIFGVLKTLKSSESSSEIATAVLSMIPDAKKDKDFDSPKEVQELLSPFKDYLDKVSDSASAKEAITSIGREKLEKILDTEVGKSLKGLKAFVVKHGEKLKQVLQIIKSKDTDKIERLIGFEFPDLIKKKAKDLLNGLAEVMGPKIQKISGFIEFIKELPVSNTGLATLGESRNLYTILPEDILNESLGILSEECAAMADDLLTVDISSVDTYPMPSSHEEGRMFGYSKKPKEGRMAKSKLHRVAKMSQSLEARLRDEDDLPEWVRSKLVTIEDRMSSVYDYLDYKLYRMKIDDEKLTENKLRTIVRKGISKSLILENDGEELVGNMVNGLWKTLQSDIPNAFQQRVGEPFEQLRQAITPPGEKRSNREMQKVMKKAHKVQSSLEKNIEKDVKVAAKAFGNIKISKKSPIKSWRKKKVKKIKDLSTAMGLAGVSIGAIKALSKVDGK